MTIVEGDTLVVHPDTIIDNEVDIADENEKGKVTHIVPPDFELQNGEWVKVKTGQEKVMEARIMGTPVEALCGFVWVPQDDPRKYPVCSKCNDIAKSGNFDPNNMNRS